jgi:hypothetical protein
MSSTKLSAWEIAALESLLERYLNDTDDWLNRRQARALLKKLETAQVGYLSADIAQAEAAGIKAES